LCCRQLGNVPFARRQPQLVKKRRIPAHFWISKFGSPQAVDQRSPCLIADTRNIPEDFRDNFGTSEKWELSGFRGVSDTNEAI
jgi:hypothetical protein